MMDEGLVAKHAVLHGVSLDGCLLLFLAKTLCKFSSCMKSRFSCISVFVLSLEDAEDGEDGAVSARALCSENSSLRCKNHCPFPRLDHLQQKSRRFYLFLPNLLGKFMKTATGRVCVIFAAYSTCMLEFSPTLCVCCLNFVLNEAT